MARKSIFLVLLFYLLAYHSQLSNCHFPFHRRPGGEKIYSVFDNQLPAALKKLPLDKHLSMQNVRKVVSEADGYQPHLIAPENGYRRLIESGLLLFRGPAEAVVDAVCLRFEFLDLESPLLFIICHWYQDCKALVFLESLQRLFMLSALSFITGLKNLHPSVSHWKVFCLRFK